ncbi:restriction endonuclease subunit S [Brachyspira sp.]|uniref:restriction endonuclease subunit S n=1 Tax=Brachyspira sp. TaxID=1977261 RepID=UPI0026326849|nr:restriction endonuclease subunit S [Brachyspira sp.]
MKNNYVLLKDISTIYESNVDKKITDGQNFVKLCNYTDVYNNWAIFKEHENSFMISTATNLEINKFILKKGMIALTKDSEKRNDIGVPTYIYDELDNVLLGYHNALIIPSINIDGSFLNAYLYTNYAKKYFMFQAKGSGQRFSLSMFSIGNLKIYYPTNKIQKKIGKIYSNIAKQIQINNNIINKLQELAETIYNYWFIQFDFPDEKGRPYKTSGGKMVWNEELGKEIPKDWQVESIIENRLSKTITSGVKKFTTKFYLPTANIDLETIKEGNIITFENRESRANMEPKKNSVWFAKMSKSIKHITLPKNSDWFINKYILSTGFVGIECKEEYLSYIHCVVCTPDFERQKDMLSHGATQKAVNNTDLKKLKLIIPTDNILKKFNKLVYPILTYKISLMQEIQELTSLRDFLLPLLMNGQVEFRESED